MYEKFLIGEAPDWWVSPEPVKPSGLRAKQALKLIVGTPRINKKYHYLNPPEKPCRNCGGFVRYKSCNDCVQCRQKRRRLRGNFGEAGRRAWETYAHQCMKCGSLKNLQLDHIVPRSLGGPNEFDNLQILCRSCNCKKGNRNSIDYRPKMRDT